MFAITVFLFNPFSGHRILIASKNEDSDPIEPCAPIQIHLFSFTTFYPSIKPSVSNKIYTRKRLWDEEKEKSRPSNEQFVEAIPDALLSPCPFILLTFCSMSIIWNKYFYNKKALRWREGKERALKWTICACNSKCFSSSFCSISIIWDKYFSNQKAGRAWHEQFAMPDVFPICTFTSHSCAISMHHKVRQSSSSKSYHSHNFHFHCSFRVFGPVWKGLVCTIQPLVLNKRPLVDHNLTLLPSQTGRTLFISSF